jgi:uncharacterized membrane protein
MENIKQKSRTVSFLNIIQIATIFASVILAIYFYQHFPERVPVHWDVNGRVNGWGPKGVGAFTFPVLLVATYFLFNILSRIDPRKKRYAEFSKTYAIIKTAIMLVFFSIYIITGLYSLGRVISVDFWIPLLIGIMFVVIGNYLGNIKNNYFVGIRTPWTLSSEKIWDETHRLGGKLFMVGGVLMALTGFLPSVARMPLFILVVLAVAAAPVVYSYLLYKRSKK